MRCSSAQKATERPVKHVGQCALGNYFVPSKKTIVDAYFRFIPIFRLKVASVSITRLRSRDQPSRALEKAEQITISRAGSPNIMTLGEKRFKASAWQQCSLQQCCFNLSQISGQLRRQFCDEKATWDRQFKSTLLPTSVSGSADIAKNRSKSARERAICDRAHTQRASLSGGLARTGRFLSRGDLPRPAEHRLPFACNFYDHRHHAATPSRKVESQSTTGSNI